MELQKSTGFLKNAYYQGHGRFVNQIVRMTLKFCKGAGNSREMRKFIETRLVDTARLNPGCVIYVKPRLFKAPVMKAEYLNGEEHYFGFYGMSSSQVEAWISWYLTRSGNQLHRLERGVTTYRPSIQDEHGRHVGSQLSATEALKRIAAEDRSFNSEPSTQQTETTINDGHSQNHETQVRSKV